MWVCLAHALWLAKVTDRDCAVVCLLLAKHMVQLVAYVRKASWVNEFSAARGGGALQPQRGQRKGPTQGASATSEHNGLAQRANTTGEHNGLAQWA